MTLRKGRDEQLLGVPPARVAAEGRIGAARDRRRLSDAVRRRRRLTGTVRTIRLI